jgi:hypothetical protein
MSPSLSISYGPTFNDLLQRSRVQVVELVPPVPLCHHESRSFQHVKVLRDRLPRRPQPVFHRQSRANLEQSLTVPLGQLVQNCPSRGVGQSFEHVTQSKDNRQATACLSRAGSKPLSRRAVASPQGRPATHTFTLCFSSAEDAPEGRSGDGNTWSAALCGLDDMQGLVRSLPRGYHFQRLAALWAQREQPE